MFSVKRRKHEYIHISEYLSKLKKLQERYSIGLRFQLANRYNIKLPAVGVTTENKIVRDYFCTTQIGKYFCTNGSSREMLSD